MRHRNLLIALSLALMLVTFPHALEDFSYRDLARFGVSLQLSISLLAITYALLLLGVALVARGSSRGALLLAAIGAIWCIGATTVHGHDMLFGGPHYRHGAISQVLEALIIALGALLALLGVRAGSSHE